MSPDHDARTTNAHSGGSASPSDTPARTGALPDGRGVTPLRSSGRKEHRGDLPFGPDSRPSFPADDRKALQMPEELAKSRDAHTFKVLLSAYASSSLIPIILIILDYRLGEYDLIYNCVPAAIIMTAMTAYLYFWRNVRIMTPVTLLTAWVGFFCTVYFRGAWDLFVIILFAFVPLSFLLCGSRQGKIWSLSFIASVLSSWMLGELGLFLPWIPLVNRNNIFFYMFGVSITYLITSSMQKQNEARTLQLIDSFVRDRKTGLPNKEVMCENIATNGLVAIVQIGNYRELSTIFGYDLSEKIIVFVSGELSKIRRILPIDAYKLMGSEFGICFNPGKRIGVAAAQNILEFVIRELQKAKLRWNDIELCLSYRAGGVIVGEADAEEVLSRAGVALATGIRFRRSVTIYEDDNTERDSALQSLSRYNTLHENIRNGALKAHVQPVVSTFTGNVCWYETLLRVQRNDGTYESVFPYLAVARTTGQYFHFTQHMLSYAEELLLHNDCDVSVNIGLADILDQETSERIFSLAEKTAHRPGKLILEILESEDLVEIDLCTIFFEKARSLGCKIAIDDFGSGYANFVNLLHIGADIVKIDGSLILRMEHDPEARLLITSIVDFCRRARKKSVAEFVENEKIYGFVKEIGIDYCQGFFFGAPFEKSDTTQPLISSRNE